jgi:hypothetical protein
VKNQFKGKFHNFLPFSFDPYFSIFQIFVFMFLQANKFMILGCFGKGWKIFDLKTIKLMFPWCRGIFSRLCISNIGGNCDVMHHLSSTLSYYSIFLLSQNPQGG